MTVAVPQAAVDAAREALDGHDLIERWRCSCGEWEVGVGPFDANRQHATHRAREVAAAVVAAVQGPLQDPRLPSVLFNDVTYGTPSEAWMPLSERKALADYLWAQGWRREFRDSDLTAHADANEAQP